MTNSLWKHHPSLCGPTSSWWPVSSSRCSSPTMRSCRRYLETCCRTSRYGSEWPWEQHLSKCFLCQFWLRLEKTFGDHSGSQNSLSSVTWRPTTLRKRGAVMWSCPKSRTSSGSVTILRTQQENMYNKTKFKSILIFYQINYPYYLLHFNHELLFLRDNGSMTTNLQLPFYLQWYSFSNPNTIYVCLKRKEQMNWSDINKAPNISE